jgi:hypothetical protein
MVHTNLRSYFINGFLVSPGIYQFTNLTVKSLILKSLHSSSEDKDNKEDYVNESKPDSSHWHIASCKDFDDAHDGEKSKYLPEIKIVLFNDLWICDDIESEESIRDYSKIGDE